jgi:predicted transcriptional regulator
MTTTKEPEKTPACGSPPQRGIAQREAERAILALLLSEPHPWTVAEIVRELGGEAIEAQDAIESLIRAGLANREGETLGASRAARTFEELEP